MALQSYTNIQWLQVWGTKGIVQLSQLAAHVQYVFLAGEALET